MAAKGKRKAKKTTKKRVESVEERSPLWNLLFLAGAASLIIFFATMR